MGNSSLHLPPLVRRYFEQGETTVPLFRRRLIAPCGQLDARLNRLRTEGLPNPTEGERFVRQLAELEPELGTKDAMLAGLFKAARAETGREVTDGEVVGAIEKFDAAGRILPRGLFDEGQRAFDYLAPRLGFRLNFSNSLEAGDCLLMNLDSSAVCYQVGNCVVNSAFFAALAMGSGVVAGEVRGFDDRHDGAWVNFGGSEFVFNTKSVDARFGIRWVHNLDPFRFTRQGFIVGASGFGFIAALLMFKVHLSLIRHSRSTFPDALDLPRLRQLLDCAEMIHPFSVEITRNRREICRIERDTAKADELEQTLRELGRLRVDSSGDPFLLARQ